MKWCVSASSEDEAWSRDLDNGVAVFKSKPEAEREARRQRVAFAKEHGYGPSSYVDGSWYFSIVDANEGREVTWFVEKKSDAQVASVQRAVAENEGPAEDDLVTEDGIHFYSSGKLVVTVSDAAKPWPELEAWMRRAGFYPSVWSISDHGNALLMER